MYDRRRRRPAGPPWIEHRETAAGGEPDRPISHAVAAAADHLGGIDILVNNAGVGAAGTVADNPDDEWHRVFDVNVKSFFLTAKHVLPVMERQRKGAIVNVSSDAAVEPYAGWGGYGSSKAALDQMTSILSEEHPGLRIYAVDPGDMRTQMHQEAFPGEDISDIPPPEDSVAGLLALIEGHLPSGRYAARELAPAETGAR